MTPEEIEFFKWYSHQMRELIQIDAITTPKTNVPLLMVSFIVGCVFHAVYVVVTA